MKVTVIIPSLNPTKNIVILVNELFDKGVKSIVVVDDGSEKKYLKEYDEIKNKVKMLYHDVNKGKGAAIKTAISNIDCDAFVTVDADLQHSVSDVLRIIDEIKNHDIVIGTRNFKTKGVPFASKFGNYISSLVFKLKTFKTCKDTQTGLRAVNMKYKDLALNTKGNRYEYEMNFLIKIYRMKLDIKTIDIQTIYKDKNKGSHFHAFRDSILIHKWLLFIPFIIILIVLLVIFI